jgi:hypothetical protein
VREEFEDTKWVIRIRISKRTDSTMAKGKDTKKTNNNLQNMHIQLKIGLKQGVISGAPEV